MLLQGLRRTALLVFVASVGGWLLNSLLKELFQRPRPEIVPHLREVMSLSFPSGHAMTSAAVYLTLGALVMRVADRPVTRDVLHGRSRCSSPASSACRASISACITRPTSSPGWLVGLSWALLCWLAERAIERRRGVEHPVR